MIKEIKMPSAGQTTDTATIAKWLVAKGDNVKRGQILLEVETDKAVLPVESFASGIVIDIRASEGDTVDAGDVLVLIGDEKDLEAASSQPSPSSSATAAVADEQEATAEDEYIKIMKAKPADQSPNTVRSAAAAAYPAMPNAKKLAKEHGVELAAVIPHNDKLITAADIQLLLNRRAETQQAAQDNESSIKNGKEYQVVPLSKMRTVIAKRMTESVQTIPAFQAAVRVDMSRLMAFKEDISSRYKRKVSFNDILMKCVAAAGKEHPLIRARYEEEELRLYPHTNIGLAVALDDGLVVPVVRSVEEKGILEISEANRSNIDNARAGRLSASDIGCGSITISNLGMLDIENFTAIVNPPESCILAIGSIVTSPVWSGSDWKPVPLMSITGSFDHRIMDGAYGAKFLKTLKDIIENPAIMLC
jgi:pyruvate dehydrogenase E2 component (dihydrolipoamide acetyltransferase)